MKLRFGFLVLSFFLLMGTSPSMRAQQLPAGMPQPVFLWPQGVSGALGQGEADKPRMYAFLPKTRSTTTAVLVVPGGGYQHVAIGHEGVQIAGWLNAQGIAAFVLDYRVAPYHFPAPILDGERAMRLIRAHAVEYGIDPNRIGVWGFSAGGHLASTLGTHCDADTVPVPHPDAADALSCKPAFMVLSYPVISMELPEAHAGSRMNLLGPEVDPKLEHEYSNQFAVTAETPQTFLFATENDPTVPVANSLDFFRALKDHHVPAELHIYDYANHGCGLCGSIAPLSTWPTLLRNWLVQRGWIPATAPAPPPPMPNMPSWIPGLTGPGDPAQK
ncbi:MAG TPA: alpha/beta hydrolase [Acidobacteriaceae bacterium]|jgi:acetyl esterase/lipase|nr:alpha/beta hydrolase [Acidobacteriaceae bacterium]